MPMLLDGLSVNNDMCGEPINKSTHYNKLKKLFEEFIDNIEDWTELNDEKMITKNLSDITKELTKLSI
jgi:hypothetical protein